MSDLREAGPGSPSESDRQRAIDCLKQPLVTVVAIAIAEEREACARIACLYVEPPFHQLGKDTAKEIAARIRARGNP